MKKYNRYDVFTCDNNKTRDVERSIKEIRFEINEKQKKISSKKEKKQIKLTQREIIKIIKKISENNNVSYKLLYMIFFVILNPEKIIY